MERHAAFGGEVVVLTGAAGGIGRTLAGALLERGARVAAVDRVRPPLASLALEADVTEAGEITGAVAKVERELGSPTMLVCAAGVVSEQSLHDLDPGEWRRVVDASLTGTFLTMQAVVPGMRARRRGAVVAFSSGYASTGYARGSHYAAAKAGVEALVKSVAREAGGDGVRVNAVAPGPVRTPMVDHIDDLAAWRAERERRIPLGRIAEPDDLVGPVVFLLGAGSAYVTGQVLHVNGGLLMP